MAENRKGQRNGRSPLSTLLLLLFFAFTLTSGMVGFLLGRNASRPTGELVDTIVLSPGDSSGRTEPVMHYLTGKVLYREGGPCAGATVRLGDGERSDVTDETGKFYFSDVRAGEHRLEVVDEGGNLLAGTALFLDFSTEVSISADTAGSPPTFRMPEDARMLELTLTVEEDKSLQVREDSAYFVTKDGQVVEFSGTSLKIGDSSYAVTPGGNVADSLGYVLLPSKGVVFTPQGGVQIPAKEGEAIPGIIQREDGAAETEEGVSVRPGGEVELPGGETLDREDKVVVIEGEKAEELDELPDAYVPAPPENVSPETPSPEPPQNVPEESSPPENAPPVDTPAPTPVPTPETGGLQVADAGTGTSWRQQSNVDLFKNRTDNLDLGEENGIPLAAPGSKGYYEFRLENPEEFDISYTIAIKEQTFHLPILYSVVDSRDNTNYLRRERSGLTDTLVSPEILIPAGTVQNFRIDWEWQYEDWYDMEGDDALDMAATERQDRTYLVSVLLSAEQVVRPPTGSADGDTKYPGKR